MKRLLTAVTLLGVLNLGRPMPAMAQDKITYYDHANKGKEATIRGVIQSESPAKIAIRPERGGSAKDIVVSDVIDVEYKVPQLVSPDYRKAIKHETDAFKEGRDRLRKREFAEALAAYQELLPKLTEERTKRHVQFKIARLQALVGGDDAKALEKALEGLKTFKKDNPKSWQISLCYDLLAQLQTQNKDWDGAQKTYEELEGLAGLSPELRLQTQQKIAQILIRGEKYDQATRRLDALVRTVPSESPQAVKLQVALAECEAAAGKPDQGVQRVEAILAKTPDPEVKTLAYNALGFCHRKANRPKDAIWAYLWVDVIYHQDRNEHAKALFYLTKLFKEVKDDKRAREFRDKLEKDKQFAGLEYQRMLTGE
jgi:tetratricopeptide (TPR) repeat protein